MAIFGNLSKKKTGVLPYVLLLLLAIILLFYISYTSFKQNTALRESTKLVSQTQDIINEINMLFVNYSSSEAAGVKYLISNDSTNLSPIQAFSDKSGVNLKKLKELMAENAEQLAQLDKVPSFSDKLFQEIRSFDKETAKVILQSKTLRDRVLKIEGYLDSLEAIQKGMINAELAMLKKRKEAYESNVTLTPTNILYSALFALGILMFAFTKINSDRKKMTVTQGFLQNVLENTDNIVNYYEPIRNENNAITDFKIAYTNIENAAKIGIVSENAIGKKLSEVYPFLMEKDTIPFLSAVVDKQKTVRREMDYLIEGKTMWFNTVATPLGDGVTTTARNITLEKEAEGKLLHLNEQLETQNLELIQTSGFLQNLVSSLQYVISYFEAVRDEKGTIIDFKIGYTNGKIKEFIGRSAEEITGKCISEVYPMLLENGDFDSYIEVINSGEPKELENLYELKEGRFYFCNEIVKLDDGVTIVSQDITLRKEAEIELQLSKDTLEVRNAILNDAEKVAGIGSYNWNIATDKMEYSDNAYRLFGYEPGGFEPSYEKFMSFVDPADVRRLENNGEEVMRQKKKTKIKFRIKTKDGKTKYMSSMGHFLEKDGETSMVGVIRDITSKTKNEQKLKLKNRALKRSNAELESFNRVASHDLQEPLRKIQMFISRLSEFDKKNISEKGRKYLEKIEDSANRMQLLIRNLLSYSRISEEVEKLHKIDLNIVFDKVLADLAEKIDETDAKITVPELPEVYGTGFQFEQLFNNLLSNALKYKKHDQSPKITITSELLKFKDIEHDLNLMRSNYLYLTLSDNGIGFEQEQSDKIFELFERLHEKHSYSGTGLGLAICKKIVESHHGHISAKSEPGKGSKFEIYLPYKN